MVPQRPDAGETGPAVLIGHYDTAHGPAVFRGLPKLQPGDRIQVKRADGSTVDFKVRSLLQAAKDRFPTEAVYGDTAAAELRLITCGAGSARTATGRTTSSSWPTWPPRRAEDGRRGRAGGPPSGRPRPTEPPAAVRATYPPGTNRHAAAGQNHTDRNQAGRKRRRRPGGRAPAVAASPPPRRRAGAAPRGRSGPPPPRRPPPRPPPPRRRPPRPSPPLSPLSSPRWPPWPPSC
ncbi:sortase domain-bontaining protein [Kitasatospora aburaviensis]